MSDKKTILIADDDKDLVTVLSKRCEQLGMNVMTADEAMTALSFVDVITPDLVCLDINMPAGNGLSVCEMMATDDRLSSIPVIMLTGQVDPVTVKRCHDLGASFVPKGGDIWARVKPLITEFLELPPQDGPTVSIGPETELADNHPSHETCFNLLCIDDDSEFVNSLKLRLEGFGVNITHAPDGTTGLREAFIGSPSAILLDYAMPNGQGDYTLRRLKEIPSTEDIPVIVLTGKNDNALKRKMFNLGAQAFLTKPFDLDQLVRELNLKLEHAMS